EAGISGLTSAWGTVILTGGLIGTLMFLNVWLIIWPNNRLMIENAMKTAKGETPIPGIAELAARAAVASRTNTLFSIPMLFFMTAASHLPLSISPEKSLVPYWSVFGILVGAIEMNAIKGKMGILQKLVHVIHGGIVLSILLYVAMAFLAG
ncbi:antitermination protein NusG, partial [bacterium]|nr:antitermination protein NusG [bacterium]